MRRNLSTAAFPAAMILVVAGILAWAWLATSLYIANPVVSLSDDWGYLNGGLDKVHSFRDTARWWTG
ncbi:MAG TPA: hypothetical protein VFI02_06310, partial [Armatimonadota bacterium]|nr:hypothetical protein [Armatimonadota bacterium]